MTNEETIHLAREMGVIPWPRLVVGPSERVGWSAFVPAPVDPPVVAKLLAFAERIREDERKSAQR